jgi:nicotinamidase-related amidase
MAAAFRAHNLPIVHIVRLYQADGSNAEPCRRHLIQQGVPLLRPESDGSQIAEALLPASGMRLNPGLLLAGGIQQLQPGEAAIYKPRWGAFYGTPLDDHLRALGVNSLAIAGCNFPNCPRTSIYEASERDYRVMFVVDAVSGIYERGVAELQSIGIMVLKADELITTLESSRPKQQSVLKE